MAATHDDATVARYFDDCQRSFVPHRKCAVLMRQFQTRDEAAFKAQFFECVDRILVVFKREPAVERVVQFVLNYCAGGTSADAASSASNSALSVELVEHLLQYSNAREKAVRFRVCQLISGLMAGLGEDAEISDELWANLQDALLARTRDKVPAVRADAARALVRLQDPEDAADPVVAELMRVMATDSSKDVRKAAVSSVCITQATLPAILLRTRDIKEDVRAFTYTTLASKVDVRQMTIAQRTSLLEQGLKDRVGTVQEACVDMVCTWLQNQLFDPVELLGCLDVEDNAEVAELMLTRIFARADGFRSIPEDELTPQAAGLLQAVKHKPSVDSAISEGTFTPAAAIFLRVRCSWLRDQKPAREEELEALIPDIVSFCELLGAVVARAAEAEADAADAADNGDDDADACEQIMADCDFVAKELLTLAQHLDFSDEAGRRRLISVLLSMVTKYTVGDAYVADLLKTLAVAHGDESSFIRAVVELISDLRTPETEAGDDGEVDTAELAARLEAAVGALEEAQAALQAAVASKDFERAAELQKGVAALEDEVASAEAAEGSTDKLLRWARCLAVTRFVFGHTRKALSMPELSGLMGTLVLPAVANEHPAIREAGLGALGLACLLDPALAAMHVPLFLSAACNELDIPEIRATAARALCDCLLVLEPGSMEGFDFTDGTNALMSLLSGVPGNDPEAGDLPVSAVEAAASAVVLQQVAAEGLAKMLFFGRIRDANVVSELLRVYFFAGAEGTLAFDEAQAVASAGAADVDAEDAAEILAEAREVTSAAVNRVKQALSVFFPAFTMTNFSNQQLVLEATVPALRGVMSSAAAVSELKAASEARAALSAGTAAKNRKVSRRKGAAGPMGIANTAIDASVSDVVDRALQFVLYLLSDSPTVQAPGGGGEGADAGATDAPQPASLHNDIVVPLLVEVAANPEGPFVRSLCKVLPSMQVSGSAQCEAAAYMAADIEEYVANSVAKKALGKAAAAFTAACSAAAPADASADGANGDDDAGAEDGGDDYDEGGAGGAGESKGADAEARSTSRAKGKTAKAAADDEDDDLSEAAQAIIDAARTAIEARCSAIAEEAMMSAKARAAAAKARRVSAGSKASDVSGVTDDSSRRRGKRKATKKTALKKPARGATRGATKAKGGRKAKAKAKGSTSPEPVGETESEAELTSEGECSWNGSDTERSATRSSTASFHTAASSPQPDTAKGARRSSASAASRKSTQSTQSAQSESVVDKSAVSASIDDIDVTIDDASDAAAAKARAAAGGAADAGEGTASARVDAVLAEIDDMLSD